MSLSCLIVVVFGIFFVLFWPVLVLKYGAAASRYSNSLKESIANRDTKTEVVISKAKSEEELEDELVHAMRGGGAGGGNTFRIKNMRNNVIAPESPIAENAEVKYNS